MQYKRTIHLLWSFLKQLVVSIFHAHMHMQRHLMSEAQQAVGAEDCEVRVSRRSTCQQTENVVCCLDLLWPFPWQSSGKPENKEEAACQLCKKTFLSKRQNNTNHLRLHHPKEYSTCTCKGLAKRARKGKTRTQPAFLDTFVATSITMPERF